MYQRRVFTMDPQYFPTARMREIIDYLHNHNQHYSKHGTYFLVICVYVIRLVLMTDPAIGYLPGQGYGTYDRGTELDVWLKAANGGPSFGVVWPGMS